VWNHKKCIAGVFCDLSRAFDHGAHDLFMKKLKFYGVRGVYMNWFYSCLNDKKQRVEL
jgi:hypothetical protein